MKGKAIDLAQIPYIEHEKRMFKAYQKINLLKMILVASNCMWLIVVFLLTR